MRRSWPRLAFALLAVSLVAAGCVEDQDADGAVEADPSPTPDAVPDPAGEAPEDEDGERPAQDPEELHVPDESVPEAVVHVVATLAPVADLVSQVGGDRVEVTPLVPAGGDAHTYEPRPRDVVVLSEADGYLGIGLGLNDGVLQLAEENLPAHAPLVLLGERALRNADLVFDHRHDDDDGHTHGDSSTDDGAGPNPHVWTSLRNAAALVAAIAEVLEEIDPEGAGYYATNATVYQEELATLERLVQESVETIPASNRTLLTYHDAWTYFARDYGLESVTAVQPADFSEPSASEVRAIIDLIRELDVDVVFGSEVFPTPVLETIAEETGADYVANLSDDVLPGQPGEPEHSYLELMRRNAHAIVDGSGGDASQLR